MRAVGRDRVKGAGMRQYVFVKTLARIVFPVVWICFALAAVTLAGGYPPAPREGAHPDLTGVYQLVDKGARLPKGLRNTGNLDELPLRPTALATQKARNPKDDVANLCMPVGPFRMMTWKGNKIDLYQSPGRITMLFEDVFLGHMRTIYLDRQHTQGPPLWVGDSIGRWEKDTLLVDTTNFNSYTWLNAAGAPHSEALHLTERYRLVGGGKYLEVKMTAEDPNVLTKPYGYTRYYEKVNTEIQEYVCWDDVKTVGE